MYWTRDNENSAYYILDLDGSYIISNGLMTISNVYKISSTNTNYRYLEFVTTEGTYVYDLISDYLEITVDSYISGDDVYKLYVGNSKIVNTIYINDGSFRILSNNLQGLLEFGVYERGFDEGYIQGEVKVKLMVFIVGYNQALLEKDIVIDANNDLYDDSSYSAGYAAGITAAREEVEATETIVGFAGSILGAGLSFILFLGTEFSLFGINLLTVFIAFTTISLAVIIFKEGDWMKSGIVIFISILLFMLFSVPITQGLEGKK